jgi:hypothetical protein
MNDPKPNGHGIPRVVSEIAIILSAGLMRLAARKSSQISPSPGESSLHFSAAESGDPAGLGRENWE